MAVISVLTKESSGQSGSEVPDWRQRVATVATEAMLHTLANANGRELGLYAIHSFVWVGVPPLFATCGPSSVGHEMGMMVSSGNDAAEGVLVLHP